MRGRIFVGTSGWIYPHWNGRFYPAGLPAKRQLAFMASQFSTVEVNGTFYSLARPTAFEKWRAETPDDFVFALKGSRYITHMLKLANFRAPLANFFASGVLALEEKLGPILWQLPPQLAFDAERVAAFLELLPRTTRAAATLARGHDHRLRHGAHVDVRSDQPLRYALEVRHETFAAPAFLRLLRRFDVACCVADTAGRWPALDAVTADFVYVRLHGDKRLYVSGYGRAALDAWAARIARWRDGGRDVFVYFDNDVKVRAPFDAMNLAARFGQGAPVRFPLAARRAVEARRGIEAPRATWDRWRMRPARPGA